MTFPKQAEIAELLAHFKVATFNIHKEPGDKIAKAFLANRNALDANLLVLQEVPRSEASATCSSPCATGRALGMYAIYAPAHHVGGKDFGSRFSRRHRSPPRRSSSCRGTTSTSTRPSRRAHRHAQSQRPRGHRLRRALENRRPASERRKQMGPILEHAAHQPTPIIRAGDFNTNHSRGFVIGAAADRKQLAHKLEALVCSYGFDTPVKDSGATHRYIGMKLDAIYTAASTRSGSRPASGRAVTTSANTPPLHSRRRVGSANIRSTWRRLSTRAFAGCVRDDGSTRAFAACERSDLALLARDGRVGCTVSLAGLSSFLLQNVP